MRRLELIVPSLCLMLIWIYCTTNLVQLIDDIKCSLHLDIDYRLW